MPKAIKFLCMLFAASLGRGYAEVILIQDQAVDLDLYMGRDVILLDHLILENQVHLSDLK